MTLDTCASYRVPAGVPGEISWERNRLWRRLKCLCLQDDQHDFGLTGISARDSIPYVVCSLCFVRSNGLAYANRPLRLALTSLDRDHLLHLLSRISDVPGVHHHIGLANFGLSSGSTDLRQGLCREQRGTDIQKAHMISETLSAAHFLMG